MKKIFLSCCFICYCLISFSQDISIAAERMNIFYLGINNPISIAAENIATGSLIIKAINGKVIKEEDKYIFRADSIGLSVIILYTNVNSILKEIGRRNFRVKRIPPPTFKIGSGRKIVPAKEIAAQQYVRAELENFDINMTYPVEEFTVHIYYSDTCYAPLFTNKGNKLSDEIRQVFSKLKANDMIIFGNIYVKGPIENRIELDSIMIGIKE